MRARAWCRVINFRTVAFYVIMLTNTHNLLFITNSRQENEFTKVFPFVNSKTFSGKILRELVYVTRPCNDVWPDMTLRTRDQCKTHKNTGPHKFFFGSSDDAKRCYFDNF